MSRQIAMLLDSFVADKQYVPAHARLITLLSDLPPKLALRGGQLAANEAWRAWVEDGRVWFITGSVSAPHTRKRDRPALQVLFYDAGGALVASGIWRFNDDGHWSLCQV